MTATNFATSGALTGLPAAESRLPLSLSIRGGIDTADRGIADAAPSQAPQAQANRFTGLGPVLELPDANAFRLVDGIVLRQELLAKNHLAQDVHWTYCKLGYPWSTLTKEPGKDVYTQALPYGSAGISIQPIPNKMWDVVKKTTNQLLQDFPLVECEPNTDAEQAQGACEMANRFLEDDATEQGTNDAVLWHDRVERSLTSSTTYIEYWVDPVGGGYIPLQIKAHPQAASPANPLFGPDGNPTTSPILRYVTPVGPDGQRQFTEDPRQADQQWQPKLRASKWQREHIRVLPETSRVEQADQVLVIGYITIGEARKRWPSIANMEADQISKLCDWTPVRYLSLLPPWERARWKLTDGREAEKGGSADERIMFYYHLYAKASPVYRKGADVVMTGAMGGYVINRALLCADVNVERHGVEQPETRCLEIPVVQITPFGDPDEQDPQGRAYVEAFAGATEHQAFLAMSAAEILDKQLHPDKYIFSASPVSGDDVEASRRSGDFIPLLSPNDKPIYGEQPDFPAAFERYYELTDEAINSIASSERAANGQDSSRERSGRAISLAVAQNNISLTGPNEAINSAYSRACRIKIEQVMAKYSTPQQLRYVGDDGAYKQDDFSGMDFSLVGRVTIRSGSGTLMSPQQKVDYYANLKNAGALPPEEFAEAVRPLISKTLGIPPDPQTQRVERQVTAFLGGPPEGWEQHNAAYAQAKQMADQQNQQQQAVWQQQSAQAQQMGIQGPPQPPMAPPVDPTTQRPIPAPWTPFDIAPMDDEPQIAAMRQRRIRRLLATAECQALPPTWQQLARDAYGQARNAVAAAQPMTIPHGVSIGVKAGPEDVGTAEYSASHPQPPQQSPSPSRLVAA